jgi:hypothetical protein
MTSAKWIPVAAMWLGLAGASSTGCCTKPLDGGGPCSACEMLATLPAGVSSYTGLIAQASWVYWYEITTKHGIDLRRRHSNPCRVGVVNTRARRLPGGETLRSRRA